MRRFWKTVGVEAREGGAAPTVFQKRGRAVRLSLGHLPCSSR